MDHLGPALKVWLDDMRKHKLDFDQVETVKERFNEWVSQVNLDEVEEDLNAFCWALSIMNSRDSNAQRT